MAGRRESARRRRTLDAAFAPFAHAFALDGDGPRFLQDLEDLVADAEPIERLLIEAPGECTNSENTDLMVHRGRVISLGRATAAIALYTFQSWAPAGGAGNRTGLRGGGPLITMVMPLRADPMAYDVGQCSGGGKAPTRDELPLVFPGLLHGDFRGRKGRDAAKRASVAMLVGYAPPHPAGFLAEARRRPAT